VALDPWAVALDPWVVALDPWVAALDPWVVALDPWVVALDPWVVALDPPAAVVGPGIMVAPHLEDHHPDSILSLALVQETHGSIGSQPQTMMLVRPLPPELLADVEPL